MQPQPYSLVSHTIMISGDATAFEGSLSIYVGDGHLEFSKVVQVGAMGLRQFQTTIEIPENIEFMLDRLIITATDDTALDPGDPNIPIVEVPVIFGPRIMPNYNSYWEYEVKKGDTLSSIAKEMYEDSSKWGLLHRANIEQISNPDLIYIGQVLKIPRDI